jgi:hypothetical protein
MTATRSPDRLYALLPAVFREQDADRGGPLRALLEIVAGQVDVVEQDIARLWNDLFIETCSPWAIAYIGDLVSNDLLYDPSRIGERDTARALFTDLRGPDLRPRVAIRTRAYVANTISYRRRKGTPPMLEELARDVTGWAAHAVEFFELLGWNQHLEHVRPQASLLDVRAPERVERVDGPFDFVAHTVDVRPIGQSEGWHSVRNVGFFLWRLGSYPLLDVPARAASPWRFHFSPLGHPAPLFTHLRREGDEAGLATELHVPGPIRRAFFAADLDLHRTTPPPDATDLYGTIDELGAPLTAHPDASLFVLRDGDPVPPAQVECMRLKPWPATRPAGELVGIDVTAGRIAVGDGFADPQRLDVEFHYGFPADIGGGPYQRENWLVARDPAVIRLEVKEGTTEPGRFGSVVDALDEWAALGRPRAVVSILDNRSYPLPATITLDAGNDLVIEARSGRRPLLTTEAEGLVVDADGAEPRAALTLSGVVVEGFVHVVGDLGALRIIHATLVPGRSIAEGVAPSTDPSIVIDAADASGDAINTQLELKLASSITGPVVCPEAARGIWVLDSIVDGLGVAAITAAPLTIERSTVLGTTAVHELEASESIFTKVVEVARTQAGCVRFSFVAAGSRTPRRHRCQSDPLVPSFVTTHYGRPEYCQLRRSAPAQIRTGAADGSEMGVYCQVKQPQRESNLRIRLDEYLPFGFTAGLIYVT